ncbi:MAG: N-acetyltransferase [Terracoccus sp.]
MNPPTQGPIRAYRPDDRDALYAVCLQTAANGGDATALHADPSLPGAVWVGPYVEFEPDLAFVLDDGAGAQGYVIGSLDTRAFEERCDTEWMPPLQRLHHAEEFEPDTRDASLVRLIHHPMVAPESVVSDYPSHLHIDLLPRWQGGGWGRRLIDTLLSRLTERGSTGVFLGVNPENEHAVGFYRHLGFEPVSTDGGLWLGRSLGAATMHHGE